jgi:hypothetical protein
MSGPERIHRGRDISVEGGGSVGQDGTISSLSTVGANHQGDGSTGTEGKSDPSSVYVVFFTYVDPTDQVFLCDV